MPAITPCNLYLQTMSLTPDQRRAYFTAAVERVLGAWQAMRMITANAPPGVDGREIERWLPGATVQWVSENRDLEREEVMEFLDVALADAVQQNVSIEDGSLYQVAKKILRMQDVCSTSSQQVIEREMSKLPPLADVSGCQVVDSEEGNIRADPNAPMPSFGGGGMSSSSAGASASADTGIPGLNFASVSIDDDKKDKEAKKRPEKPTTDEDGWTTVPTRKK